MRGVRIQNGIDQNAANLATVWIQVYTHGQVIRGRAMVRPAWNSLYGLQSRTTSGVSSEFHVVLHMSTSRKLYWLKQRSNSGRQRTTPYGSVWQRCYQSRVFQWRHSHCGRTVTYGNVRTLLLSERCVTPASQNFTAPSSVHGSQLSL